MIKAKPNYQYWVKLSVLYFFLQNLVRLLFVIERPPSFIDAIDALFDGFLWDSGTWLILSLPLILLSIFGSESMHLRFLKSKLEKFCTFIFVLTFTYIGFCEITFWNEFHSRFNFIAVDYLIYTNEVLANLRESFPMEKIACGVLIFSLILTWASTKIKFIDWTRAPFFGKRTTALMVSVAIPGTFLFGVNPLLADHEENFHDDQISRNGVLEFVRAFRSNQIDYQAFYPILTDAKAEAVYATKTVQNVELDFGLQKSRPNIVFIAVESLGAKFIGSLSQNKDTTPYLNELSGQAMFFENFYATGTRTVRGLEALTLSVPPTPGYAVVKRPDNKNLYSMGNTFAKNGYDPLFLYGGRGFFDNMNAFFSGNGFRVYDQGDFKKSQITFKNAWGVCDEDLFNKAQEIINQREDQKKPFLLFMLTTSNHRPFTYPPGKIDIPSGISRAGAVKYTDFAIGNFLKQAQKEKWAKNTVFVIVADHSTEGRGQFDLEMSDFHIPLWIYSPGLINPQVISKLSSQIDLLPSLIHLLGLKDDSPFFGRSIFNPNWKDQRAFVGNYQFVGYYRDQVLTTLGPNQAVRNFSFNPLTKKQTKLDESPFVDEAISYYQLASKKLENGDYKVQK